MKNNNINSLIKGLCVIMGAAALVSVSVTACGKKTQEEKVLSNMEYDMEDVEIEEDIKAETFEKDGVSYKKISGNNLSLTYPVLEGAVYEEKVNDCVISSMVYTNGYGGTGYRKDDRSDIVMVDFFIGIEPFYFDESHSELLSSTEEVSYITYRLYNAKAYLFSSMYGLNETAEKPGITYIPRDESVLGLKEPTKPLISRISKGEFYDIVADPVSLIETDFQCGTFYEMPDGTVRDDNQYLTLHFVFEEADTNCTDISKANVLVAEELDKAVLEAEIHYKSGETEKKYVGFKSYNGVNPCYYDVYTVEIE